MPGRNLFMADIVDKDTRSRMMSGIRGKDTKPEIAIRKALFARGLRYRIHYTRLPGKPDIVLPKHKAIILVNGCFWHGHDCHLFKWPSTRKDFWKEKISLNRERDKKNIDLYHQRGWRVMTVWECALKGKTRRPIPEIIGLIENWIFSGFEDKEITGGPLI